MAAFKLSDTNYYLQLCNPPPCQHCESCSIAIKEGRKRCPYLDQPFLTKVRKTKFNRNIKKWLSANPYTFIDFPLHYILSNTFERIEDDSIRYELYF